jgi:integrase
MAALTGYLRRAGAIPVAKAADLSGIDALIADFSQWLAVTRGIAPWGVKSTVWWARLFVETAFHDVTDQSAVRVSVEDVEAFVVAMAARCKPSSMGAPTTALRRFIEFASTLGLCDRSLRDAVPTVKRPRQVALPTLIAPDVVARVLDGCGPRDAAIVALCVDLGLRGGEIGRLTLDDIDWAHAAVSIVGKNGLRELMPLTERAGEALATWIRQGRRPWAARRVFHTAKAPLRPMTAVAVSQSVKRAGARVGADAFSTRAARHSLACAVVSEQGTLSDAGQLLRHLSSSATAVYARVDREALSVLATPWPGEQS